MAFATSAKVSTATQTSTGFEDLTLNPFFECTFFAPAYGSAVTLNGVRCAQVWWSEEGYDGRRLDRGMEICPPDYTSYKEGWLGFSFYLPASFPTNRESGIGQIFQSGYCNSWAAMLAVVGNELQLSHRSYCGPATQAQIAPSIQRDAWNQVIVHYVASHLNAGKMEVWYNGSLVYNAQNINFGFGTWNSDDTLAVGNGLGMKAGLYAYDTVNYTNLVRTFYYDNLCMIVGNPPGAFDTANPAGGASIANGTYRLRNRASGKYLDNKGATTDGAVVGQWDYSVSNNLRWVVSTAGSNYRKLQCVSNGKFLDSIGNTADNTPVGQWANSSSFNQQWNFVEVGGGYWKILNRSNGKALDTGGDNATGAVMENWASSSSYNQQWQFIAP